MVKEKDKKTPISNLADFLHIKTHTVSTSNEISLSVLDALSKKADGNQNQVDTENVLGGVSLFTLDGAKKNPVPTPKRTHQLPGTDSKSTGRTGADVAGYALDLSMSGATAAARKRAASLPNPEAEISRRKARRRSRRMVATVVGLAGALCVVGALVFFVNNEYTNHQDYLGDLDTSIAGLTTADEVIIPIDELLLGPIDKDSIARAEELQPQVADTQTLVSESTVLADRAYEGMYDSSDKEAARQASLASNARTSMLENADVLMSLGILYYYACDHVTKAWGLVFQADTLAQEAAVLIKDTTPENTQASQEKSEAALNLLYQAKDEVNAAAELFGYADLTALSSYIDKRIEAMQYAIASDEAIYVQDKGTAEAQNELYNQAEAEAADMAADLPEDPIEPLTLAYEEESSSYMEAYMAARDQAADADAFLRDYLGIEK